MKKKVLTALHLRDVEVMANRADHRTPVAFSNLTAAEIERVNDGRDIPFLLESMPSVVTTGDGVRWSALLAITSTSRKCTIVVSDCGFCACAHTKPEAHNAATAVR